MTAMHHDLRHQTDLHHQMVGKTHITWHALLIVIVLLIILALLFFVSGEQSRAVVDTSLAVTTGILP